MAQLGQRLRNYTGAISSVRPERHLDMVDVTGSSPVLPTTLEIVVNLLDWIKGRKSKPGMASGERVNESLANHTRLEHGLPPQRKAWLIDLDGTKNSHDLNTHHNGEPHAEVRVRLHQVRLPGQSEAVEEKVYQYAKESEGWLIYQQV